MEAIAKAIEVLGTAVRPAVFACLLVCLLALVLPLPAWQALGVASIPVPRWWFVGAAVFAVAYLLYEPVTSWFGERRIRGAMNSEAKRMGDIVEGLSPRGRTWLYVLLENNQTAFDWTTNTELVNELDAAGVIRPQQALSNYRMRYVFSDWYWQFSSANRVWLHANLDPDPILLAKFRGAYLRADSDDERI